MSRHSKRALIQSALACALLVPFASAGAQSSPVDALKFIAGCWIRTSGATTVEEQWMAPKGGMMLGVSRTVNAGKVREFEQLRIFTIGDTLVYGALPSRQSYSEFRTITVQEREVVFENLKHDFPQRIGYRAAGDSLLAYIEGPQGALTRRIPFAYVRTSCPDGKL